MREDVEAPTSVSRRILRRPIHSFGRVLFLVVAGRLSVPNSGRRVPARLHGPIDPCWGDLFSRLARLHVLNDIP